MTQKACIGVGYKKELQETVKPGAPGGNSNAAKTNEELFPHLNTRASQVRDRAAKKVGVSGKVVDMAERMMDIAPAKAERMMAGELSVWDAKREIEHEAKEALAEHLNAQPVPLPSGRFNVINGHPMECWIPHAIREVDALRERRNETGGRGIGYNLWYGNACWQPAKM